MRLEELKLLAPLGVDGVLAGPYKRSTVAVDAILAKSDSLWTTADIATVLRWIVSAMREA